MTDTNIFNTKIFYALSCHSLTKNSRQTLVYLFVLEATICLVCDNLYHLKSPTDRYVIFKKKFCKILLRPNCVYVFPTFSKYSTL